MSDYLEKLSAAIEAGKGKCPKCWGTGKVAGGTDDQDAWPAWGLLDPGADLAVQIGAVYPITCPECRGTGELPTTEPTEPGWYASADGRLGLAMIFLRLPDLDVPGVIERHGAWRAYTADGDATDCVWAYIAQAGPVVPLTRPAR